MAHRTPTVTIDLAEYNELIKSRDTVNIDPKIMSNLINEAIFRIRDSQFEPFRVDRHIVYIEDNYSSNHNYRYNFEVKTLDDHELKELIEAEKNGRHVDNDDLPCG